MPLSTKRFPPLSLTRELLRGILLLLPVVSFLLVPSPAYSVEKLRVSHCYIGGAVMPLWAAKEAGLFNREGLDVEMIWIQGNPSVASLMSGEIDLLYCIPHTVISAIAGGKERASIGDTVVVTDNGACRLGTRELKLITLE